MRAPGLRDRAIIETLYTTGMRRLELVNLKVWDLDIERAAVTICQGKGKRTDHSAGGSHCAVGKEVSR